MTEKGKKPETEAGQPDALSATGMFLNAFRTEPEPPVEQLLEDPARGGVKAAPPGEFTQMFHKLEPPPSPPLPPARSANNPPQEPGEFTRTFVAAATSPGLRPAPAAPVAPKMRGFSAPGISDSASPEGSFTQLFQTPAAPPAPAPVRPFTPLPSAPPHAAEPAWPQSLDPVPNEDRVAPGGLTQLFRSLSEENAPPPLDRIGESSLMNHRSSPMQPPAGDPASVTMLIQRLNEDHPQPAAPAAPTLTAAASADLSGPGEFTRIIAGGATNRAPAAGNFAMPAPPTLVFPAVPVPAVAPPQVPALAVPPAQPPKVAPSAPPPKSKLQQMLPMLLVLNAFLVVVLILLLVFALKSR
jgi:hypothetical protein